MNTSPIAAAQLFWQRRVIGLIVSQLKQGTAPEKIALSITLGMVIGIFPILGATTIMCSLMAWRLKLNQPLIQLTNYLMSPLHLLLLLPFYRAGETLFAQPHVPIFSITQLMDRFSAGPMQFIADYSMVGVYGIVVWCLAAPLTIALVYLALRPALQHLSQRLPKKRASAKP